MDTKFRIPTKFDGKTISEYDRTRLEKIRVRNLITARDLEYVVGLITSIRGDGFVYQDRFGNACANFKYEGNYADGTRQIVPACIIGSALYLLGFEGICPSVGAIFGTLTLILALVPGVQFTEGFARAGVLAQNMQDNRANYGSVRTAINAFNQHIAVGKVGTIYDKVYDPATSGQ